MIGRLIAGLVIVVIPCALAQDSTRRVNGSVVDADTGQPIEHARLQLFGAGHTPLIFTGKDGVFALEIPADSRPLVYASAEGYVGENSRAFLNCSPCDVTFQLHARVVFSGRVIAADNGEPIMYVQVDAFPFVGGQLSKKSASRALTDSAGRFWLEQLPAGQYFLRFTPSDAIATLPLGDIEDPQSRRFLPQWWPGGATWQNASPVSLTGGSSTRLPDIQLSPEARFTISGRLLPQYCHDDESFQVAILRDTNGSAKMLRSALVKCGADYAFSDLTSGAYRIVMDESSGHSPASLEVQIKNENVRADLPIIGHPTASGSP